MRLEDLTVEVRDAGLNRVGLVAPCDLNLECYPLFNGVGTWTLTLPVEHPLVPTITTPGSGLIVTGPVDTIMSGPYLSYAYTATTDDSRGSVVLSGISDEVKLADALAWPEPINDDATSQTTAYDERTDASESLMYAYVDANIGPSAPDSRRWDSLTLGADGGRGTSVTKQARFPVLGQLLAELGLPDGLGFRVSQQGRVLVFETFQTNDLSFRLSLDGSAIASLATSVTAPTVTRVVVGAAGDGIDRQFVFGQTDASIAAETQWGRRIETFIDQRAVSGDPTAQLQSALDALASGGITIVSAQAVGADDTSFQYRKDWFLGDRITLEVLGNELVAPITGLVLKADSDGVQQGLVLGDPTQFSTAARIDKQANSIDARVSRLERAQ